jgi:hypothetical protein
VVRASRIIGAIAAHVTGNFTAAFSYASLVDGSPKRDY